MTLTARIKYVLLDVVGFTRDRSVEAQSDIVSAMNAIVLGALDELQIAEGDRVLIPTGDGIAVAMLDSPRVDLHLQLGLGILREVAAHNAATSDKMRTLEIRVGVNENVDNVLTDINGRRNVAGAGISMAQRIMDQADGGQLLTGSVVYETLRQRERHMSAWRVFHAHCKHGASFTVYQYAEDVVAGLNVSTPSAFRPPTRAPAKLSQSHAYYLAHAIANRDFLTARAADSTREYSATILLWFLAEDSQEAANSLPHQRVMKRAWEAGVATFEQQYSHYDDMEFWPMVRLAGLIQDTHLQEIVDAFEHTDHQTEFWLAGKAGVRRLAAEWPDIALAFGISAK